MTYFVLILIKISFACYVMQLYIVCSIVESYTIALYYVTATSKRKKQYKIFLALFLLPIPVITWKNRMVYILLNKALELYLKQNTKSSIVTHT